MSDDKVYTTSEVNSAREMGPACMDNDCISGADSEEEDARLLECYRYARCRQQATAPDVEKAWERFKSTVADRNAGHCGARRLHITGYVAVAAASVIVAVVSISLLVKSVMKDRSAGMPVVQCQEYTVDDNGHIIAFEANDAPQITMIGTDGKNMRFIGKTKDCGNIMVDSDKAVCCNISRAMMLNTARKTITTPRGKQFEIVLGDGSKVTLNADSRLSFPVGFAGGNREVELCGEAYFEVVKDSSRPFVVKTEKITVTVLGTEFDVRAYGDQSQEVTLVNGSVEVSRNAVPGDNVVLYPGQNACLSSGNTLDVYTADIANCVSWRCGLFHYDDVRLMNVVKDMGRWYNVDVEITDSSVRYYPVTFELPRTGSLAEFVEKLGAVGFLSVSVEGHKVVIGRCHDGNVPMVRMRQ